MEKGALRKVLRILAWALAAAIALCIGFALIGAAWLLLGAGQFPLSLDRLRRGVWWILYATVVSQALLPHLLLSLVAWLAVARRFPTLDRSRRTLVVGTALTAAVCFPVIGSVSFTAWTPSSVRDYLATLLLMAGGTSAALLLPRWLFRSLAPGAFAPSPGGRSGPAP